MPYVEAREEETGNVVTLISIFQFQRMQKCRQTAVMRLILRTTSPFPTNFSLDSSFKSMYMVSRVRTEKASHPWIFATCNL